MAVLVLNLRLRPGVEPSEFESFMTDEIFPSARTFTTHRIGLHDARHTLLHRVGDASSYRWIVDWVASGGSGSDSVFHVALTRQRHARLSELATCEHDLYTVVARAEEQSITTPTIGEPADQLEMLGVDKWLGGENVAER